MKTKTKPSPADAASEEPLHIAPTDIVAFLGRERFDRLAAQAERLGFTGKTLLDAAIARTPRDLRPEVKPAIAALHLIRLAGSAPSKRDRVRLQAAEKGLRTHDVIHPELGILDTILVSSNETVEELRAFDLATFEAKGLPLPKPTPTIQDEAEAAN